MAAARFGRRNWALPPIPPFLFLLTTFLLAYSNETSFDFTIDRSILDGTGVHCFIVDSGVDTNHVEFQ